jgi:hypothetical protein
MMLNNSTKNNKTSNNLSPKESLSSDGKQFHQYRERLLLVSLILVELFTITA